MATGDPPTVSYEGQLTVAEWLGAYAAHKKAYPHPAVDRLIFWAWFVGFAAAVTLTRAEGRVAVILMGTVSLYALAHGQKRTVERLTRHFNDGPALKEPFRTRIDETGFTTTTDLSTDRRPWSLLSAWLETSEAFLLYESTEAFRVIPKRVLSEHGAVDALRQWFTDRLGPSGLRGSHPRPSSH